MTNQRSVRSEIVAQANRFRVWQQIKRHAGNISCEDLARITGLGLDTVKVHARSLKITRKSQRGLESNSGRPAISSADLYMTQAHIAEGFRMEGRE